MTRDAVLPFAGRAVSVALADRTRIDDAVVEGVVDDTTLWLYETGRDLFLPLAEVLEVWAR